MKNNRLKLYEFSLSGLTVNSSQKLWQSGDSDLGAVEIYLVLLFLNNIERVS